MYTGRSDGGRIGGGRLATDKAKSESTRIQRSAIAPVYRGKAIALLYTEELATPGSRR